ncbi:recombinase family protein [Ornithinimicrobium sp. Arc0846-15]|nr:recombinase family protein [Ornithinimicrobium laminariae]
MSGQIVGYVRVSSVEQNPARQIAAIGTVDETFTDQVSGKSRSERPELARMLRHVRRGDTVRVSSMDRLARSVIDLAQIIQELNNKQVEVEFVTERLTFAAGAEDPFAMFQLHMLGAVAQLERSLIKERQREGIDIARTKGVYRGRSRALSPEQISQAHDKVEAGVPKTKIARDLGCSRRALYDALQARGAYATS